MMLTFRICTFRNKQKSLSVFFEILTSSSKWRDMMRNFRDSGRDRGSLIVVTIIPGNQMMLNAFRFILSYIKSSLNQRTLFLGLSYQEAALDRLMLMTLSSVLTIFLLKSYFMNMHHQNIRYQSTQLRLTEFSTTIARRDLQFSSQLQ